MTDWVVDVIDRIGAVGVGLLIALETVIPPIPSEVVLPFAGFSAARGEINIVAAWVAATLGALGGAYVLYGLGWLIGRERLYQLAAKRWFIFFGTRDLARGDRFWDRHGHKIVLAGRCIPLLRSVVSVPAGVDRMPLAKFSLYTVLGSAAWNAGLLAAGWYLEEEWHTVEGWIAPAGYAVAGLLAVGLIVLAVRKVRRHQRAPTG